MKMLEEALHTAVRRFGARALAANAAQFTRSPEDIWCEAREMRDTLEAGAAQRSRTAFEERLMMGEARMGRSGAFRLRPGNNEDAKAPSFTYPWILVPGTRTAASARASRRLPAPRPSHRPRRYCSGPSFPD